MGINIGEFDENNNMIYFKSSCGLEEWYKYKNNKSIEITQKEFKNIKRKNEYQKMRNRPKISRFELMDI